MAEVRVRFAPSPTGFFHIGSARTALFNWLYARHCGGKFVLRIEDTDKERNTEEALRVLIDGMQWLGLDWDEGPGAGGDYGPYFQSQRGDIYKEYLEKLTAAGRTYEKEGAIWFKLEGERYTEFDKHADAEVEKVRTEPVIIDDAVRGRVERREQKDFVLMRSDGSPVFHFVNVVDDIAMGITHVIRGEDHLSNTSKHVELFKAFGVEPPRFAHIPLILKSEGKGKMSKRDVGALIEEYEIKGYLPEAVRNYICLLGWSPKDDQEIMPIDDIIERFDFAGINKGNARFDEKKLNYINGEYLRKLPVETFCWLVRAPLTAAGVMSEDADEDYFQRVMMLCQEKTNAVADLPDYVRYFFSDVYPTDEKARAKIFKKGDPLARLTELKPALETATDWSEECLEKIMGELCEKTGAKTGEYIHATRLAVSGTNVGPSFYGLLAILGKERTLARIDRFLAENKG